MSNFYLSKGTKLSSIYNVTAPQTGPATNYLESGTDIKSKFLLYMFGTCKNSGYLVKGVDIGASYQIDAIGSSASNNALGFSGGSSKNYANELGNYTLAVWGGAQGAVFANAKWIWNDPAGASGCVANSYMWFYSTFYYSGSSVNGRAYGICDDVAYFYLNGTGIGTFSAGWGAGSNGNNYAITLIQGINYIKIAAYNTGGPAGLIATFYDGASVNVANTNGSWAFTLSSAYQSGSLDTTAS
jgi:hypothetical protein